MSKESRDKNLSTGRPIAVNRKAYHEYTLEERFEAGLVLEGWEVKSLRAGKAQLTDGYILFKKNEAWLIGAQITPLLSASTHVHPDPGRTRKLLLHRRQINNLLGLTQRKGYTLIPLSMYWSKGRAKLEFALAKGKKKHDKREAAKDRDWAREKQKLNKLSRRST